ncbi:hypothetical protein CBR_g23342 [Chara braunii]|uniref:DEAD/DEAH-box helicase domain-containing protein n=1 Tax=Chara braunii TaxID=69332 RepID=A0A388L443_CHABU|nr:hypothetical protein CBR_g23342 [Chara braunii]|eukprot:GBG77012.1 hypothetical protein CBR_g23342 [Chara braunii]
MAGTGQEYAARKKAKASRKRLRAKHGDVGNETSAAKRRRRKKHRRVCEAMCYSLPTPENPFNEAELKGVKTPSRKRKPTPGAIETSGKKSDAKKAAVTRGGSRTGREREEEEGEGLRVGERTLPGNGCGDGDGVWDGDGKQQQRRSIFPPFRKNLWPFGPSGKGELQGIDDKRLPSDFRRCFFIATGQIRSYKVGGKLGEGLKERGLQEGGGVGDGDVKKGKQGEPLLFERRCWEGCLRGRDVLGVLPPPAQRSVLLLNRPDRNTSPTISSNSKRDPYSSVSMSEQHDPQCGTLGFAERESSGVLGYLLPAVFHLKAQQPAVKAGEGPIALIVVATAERAREVRRVCKPLQDVMGFRCVSVHSQAPIGHQIEGLGCQVVEMVVGTAARLSELLRCEGIRLGRVSFFVLHDVDELLQTADDQNPAAEQLSQIASAVRSDRQVVFLSRKFSVPVNVLLGKLWLPAAASSNPIIARAANEVSNLAIAVGVTQTVCVCSQEKKTAKIASFLGEIREGEKESRVKSRTVVLTRGEEVIASIARVLKKAKHRTELVTEAQIKADRLSAMKAQEVEEGDEEGEEDVDKQEGIDGGYDSDVSEEMGVRRQRQGEQGVKRRTKKKQCSRRKQLKVTRVGDDFRVGRATVLIATASALSKLGMDLESVPCLVFYDFPGSFQEYLCQISKVARKTARARIHSLFTKEDALQAVDLVAHLEECGQLVDDKLQKIANAVLTVRKQQQQR